MMTQPYQRFTLAMLMMATIICTADKLIFAFAGPSIIRDLDLSPLEFGLAGSAFFFIYSIAGVAVGFLANRVQTKWILTGMSLIWAVSQFAVGFAGSLGTLIAARLLLGAGTGPATAVTQHAGFKWYAPNERLGVSTMIHVSVIIGGLVASAVLPLAVQHLGWRTSYLLLGLASVGWVGLWLPFGREGTVDAHASVDTSPKRSYRQTLLNKSFVMISLLGFIGGVPSVVGFSWLAVFLQEGVGLNSGQMSLYLVCLALTLMFVNLLVMAGSKRALRNGTSFQKAMVWPPLFAIMIGGAAYLGLRYVGGNMPMTLALYLIASVASNLLPPFAFAIVAHLCGASQRGAVLAIYNGIVTLAGIVTPGLIGYMISDMGGDASAGFDQFFTLCGGMALAVSILAFMVLDPEKTRKRLDLDCRMETTLRSPASS
ncbi:MFS transporter [Achromobacter sp. Marseille-Q4954]|uniref:MFS transporter n=1 Tax=Achromobacter sp. Marseille-Q4954 TaxID=2942203 RepID=UPI0020749008|nr:MFS transporter [Achromobacter sp. Marseille-Q4954]